MDAIVEFIKAYLVPGSIAFLLIAASLGVPGLFFNDRWRRRSRNWLTGLLLAYWLMSLPACASAIEASLSRGYAPLTSAQAADLDLRTIVILGGGIVTYEEDGRVLSTLSGSTSLRVIEAARLYDLLGDPVVIASGGGAGDSPPGNNGVPESLAMRQALISLGVPDARILEESSSNDTREEALNISLRFSDQVGEPFALVTSPTHMRRAQAAFRAVGLQPVPSPAAATRTITFSGLRSILPSFESLSVSGSVFREYMALAYYGLRGWTSPP